MQGTRENGTRSKKDHKIQVIRRMLYHLRSSMHQIDDRGINLRSIIRSPCGARLVEGIIS